MLDQVTAQKLLQQLAGTIEYNINIINEKGIIIASCDASRVGTFHELAYDMIVHKKDLVEIGEGDNYFGTRSGVNMTIVNMGQIIGVVGITGNPTEVRPLARLLKTAVEILIEHEIQQQKQMNRLTMEERFFSQLLYAANSDVPARELLCQSRDLGYDPSLIRIPVLTVASAPNRKVVTDMFRANFRHTRQDMLSTTSQGDIVALVHLSHAGEICGTYRVQVQEYLEPVIQQSRTKNIQLRFYVGTMQSDLHNYRMAYRHALWLRNSYSDQEEPVFFYDYVSEYLNSCVPYLEQQHIFGTYAQCMGEEYWRQYITLFSALDDSNNNMVVCAKKLHMHKNSLSYQYNKYRNLLNINPTSSAADRKFSASLCSYLQKRAGQ